MKKSIAIILSIMLVLAITFPATAISTITVKSIKLNNSKITLKVGQTYNLKVTLTPTNTTQKLLTYTTSNKKIANVDKNGKITAVSAGTTVINVISSSNKKIFAKCNVTISKPAKQVKLQFYMWGNSGSGINDVIRKFENQNPNIVVNVNMIPSDDTTTALKTKLLAGENADVIWTHPTPSEFGIFAKSGLLSDLSGAGWASKIQEGALKFGMYNGKLYGLPVGQYFIGVYYNKKVFADLGLSVPTTWTELINVCEKIKANNISPFALAMGDWPKLFMLYPLHSSMIMSQNQSWYDDRTAGKVSFTDWAPMIDKYVEIIKNYAHGGSKGAFGVKYDTHIQLVDSGQAAMLIQGTWAMGDFKKIDPKAESKIGMFALNALDDPSGLCIPTGIGTNYCVVAKSKYQEEAKKFIEFFATPDSVIPGDLPVIKGYTGDVSDFIKENMIPLAEQGKVAPFMDVHFPPAFSTIWSDLDQVITLEAKPIDVVKKWDKVWDDAIQKANSQ